MFHPVARVADLPPGTLLAVTLLTGQRVCLANAAGELCAFLDECPHAAFPMSAGEALGDGTMLCTWHGARFDAHTGAVIEGPADAPLVVYEVRVANGEILVGSEQPR